MYMKKNIGKVLVLGYFGKQSNIQEGQSVKTRNVSRILKEIGCDVVEFDTESFRYDKLAILNLLRMLASSRKVCVLPAYNNLKWLLPVIYLFSVLFRYKIYLFTIGGRLHIYLKTLPLHRYMLRRIERIFNETHLLGSKLKEMYGYKNLTYIPNVKFMTYNPVAHHDKGTLKLVFLARIVAEKGLDVIFNYCQYLKKAGRHDVFIDFYGMIASKDKQYFEDEVKKYSFACYNGVAKQQDIPCILEKYDAMLFPTHFPTEGIPGSVLDAYIAGIPVIASNWVYAGELVENGKTGIIIPFENNYDDFIEACEYLLENEKELEVMKKYAHKKSAEYNIENVKNTLKKFFL